MIERILHQQQALAKIVEMLLYRLLLNDRLRQTLTPAQKQMWATMFEDV